jgi:hypothetical protein
MPRALALAHVSRPEKAAATAIDAGLTLPLISLPLYGLRTAIA